MKSRNLKLALGLMVGLLLFLPSLASAQLAFERSVLEDYDLDATTMTYCTLPGNFTAVTGRAVTSGSNTTITGNGSDTPFLNMAAGDVIIGLDTATGAMDVRTIITWTNSTSITVSPAVDWSGVTDISWKKLACGTTSADGWVPVNGRFTSMIVQVDQMNVTGGIDFRWECRSNSPYAKPVQVCPTTVNTLRNVGTAGITDGAINCVVEEPYQACRVGMAIHTSDDGGDTGANRESISISFQERPGAQ